MQANNRKCSNIKCIFVFQSLVMNSLEPLSTNNLEVMDIEKDPIINNVMNINRNKIEAIPKTNQVFKYIKKKKIV